MPVILDFRPLGHGEAQTAENLHYLVAHKRQRMAGAKRDRACRTAQVKRVVKGLGRLGGGLQGVDFLSGEKLQGVDFHPDGLLLVGGDITEIGHQVADLSFLREIFDSEGLDLFRSGGLQGLDLSLETMDFF